MMTEWMPCVILFIHFVKIILKKCELSCFIHVFIYLCLKQLQKTIIARLITIAIEEIRKGVVFVYLCKSAIFHLLSTQKKTEHMQSDLSKVKAGDEIWTIREGYVRVTGVYLLADNPYRIRTKKGWTYTFDGRVAKTDKYPSAFTYNPFKIKELEQRPEQTQERVVLVRDRDDEEWIKRVFHMEKNGVYMCWSAKCLGDAKDTFLLTSWKQMKELPKMTAQEAADKLGITVDELRALK